MTGKELILKAMNNEELPRVPWVPYTGVQIGQLTGYNATELLQDGEKLYKSLIEAEKQYSPDGMPVIFDLQVEAEVLGCELKWADDSPPTVSAHPLASEAVVPTKMPGKKDGRIPMILDVMKRFRAAAPDTALYGLSCGPFTLASHLRSTNLFMDMYDNPEYVSALLEYCTDVFLTMADYYIEAGMDIVAPVDPLISQISPDAFEQFMSKPYKRLFDALRDKGVKSSFFVCGDATKNLEVMCKVGPDCLGIDENIDLAAAKEITDRHNVVISGNIQLTVVMLLGNQRDAMKAALEKIDSIGKRNFILAPGCDMPFNTPVENVIGVAQAAQDPEAARKLVEGYVKEETDIEVDMPDYAALDHVLIEVLTIDSATCAACGYMKSAADDMVSEFGDKVEILERKITEPENIARLGKLGVANLPTIVINGEVKFISVIPNREELKKAVSAVL
ncbi:MAG: uroporphyrinogen decarboxylase family protein [Spirochaetaceae bacterium]|nr:uroporphyrinogen decarboxylase family protein [Spirochaetaceae bacterium]